MSKAFLNYGAKYELSGDDGETWYEIPKVHSTVYPNVERGHVEVTSLDSPNGFKEYIQGLKDISEIELSAHYTREAFKSLKALENKALNLKITLQNGDKFEVDCYSIVSPDGGGVEDSVKMTIKIRPTGSINFTAGE